MHPLPAGTFQERLAPRATQTGPHGLYWPPWGVASATAADGDRAGQRSSEGARYWRVWGPPLRAALPPG